MMFKSGDCANQGRCWSSPSLNSKLDKSNIEQNHIFLKKVCTQEQNYFSEVKAGQIF
jgi:hypothetical protein